MRKEELSKSYALTHEMWAKHWNPSLIICITSYMATALGHRARVAFRQM